LNAVKARVIGLDDLEYGELMQRKQLPGQTKPIIERVISSTLTDLVACLGPL